MTRLTAFQPRSADQSRVSFVLGPPGCFLQSFRRPVCPATLAIARDSRGSCGDPLTVHGSDATWLMVSSALVIDAIEWLVSLKMLLAWQIVQLELVVVMAVEMEVLCL